MEIRRRDYTMLMGNMKVINEMLKSAVKSPEGRQYEKEKIEKFVKKKRKLSTRKERTVLSR